MAAASIPETGENEQRQHQRYGRKPEDPDDEHAPSIVNAGNFHQATPQRRAASSRRKRSASLLLPRPGSTRISISTRAGGSAHLFGSQIPRPVSQAGECCHLLVECRDFCGQAGLHRLPRVYGG
jgi:hypothetical protein